MSATTLVAARMDPELRGRVQRIIEPTGITESQLIRRLYGYVAQQDEVPAFLTVEYDGRALPHKPDKFERAVEWIEHGPFSQVDWSFLGDADWDELYAQAMEEKYKGW